MVKLNFGVIEVFSKGLNWITLPLLAYVTSLELYGKISSYYSLVMILSVFYTFGQNRNILQSKTDELDENTALSVYVGFFLLILSVFFIGSFLEDKNLYLCVILAFFLSIYTNFSLKIRANNNLKEFVFFKSYYGVRLLLLLLFLWIYPSFKTFIWIDVILLLIFFGAKFKFIKPKNNFKYLINQTKKSLLMMCFSFSIIFIMGFDKIYLSKHIEYSVIGGYNLAFVFATGITFLASYFAIIYERNIYISHELTQARLRTNEFIKKTIFFSIISLPFVFFVYWIYSKFIMVDPRIKIFFIIYFSQLIYFFCLGKSFLLIYRGEYRKLALLSIFSAGLNVLLNIFLVRDYSILGSALSNLISFLIMALFFIFWSEDK